MTVTRGKKHVFLGIEIVFKKDGTVQTKIKEHIKDAVSGFKNDITTSVVTPATRDLFEINEDSPKLSVEDSENYHSTTGKLLYISKRARLDIQLAVAFLCKRVSCCDKDDWRKLKRVLQYLRGTIDDTLIMGADSMHKMCTWDGWTHHMPCMQT